MKANATGDGTTQGQGGGIFILSLSIIYNCTITNNFSSNSGGGYRQPYSDGNGHLIINTIIWGNVQQMASSDGYNFAAIQYII